MRSFNLDNFHEPLNLTKKGYWSNSNLPKPRRQELPNEILEKYDTQAG